ncbi:MAG TPA: hypothetical protein VIL49_00745, partial [Capillimicrobium sp.]
MLLRPETVDGIRAGRVSLAFRQWDRPRVRPGTRHRAPGGVVEIVAVAPQDEPLSEDDARAAGFARLADLEAAQRPGRPGSRLYRVELRWGGEDERVALRQRGDLDAEEAAELVARLDAI